MDFTKVMYTRTVYSLIDWFCDIAGVFELTRWIFIFVFGNFVDFNFTFETMRRNYTFTDK